MKTLKFRESLSKLILAGKKTVTWRLFDDKNLAVGDKLSLVVWESGQEFARARIIGVRETLSGGLTESDWEEHERFASEAQMYATFSAYYSRPVLASTPVKIITFQLLK